MKCLFVKCLLLLIIFSSTEATQRAGWQRPIDMAHVLTSMSEGKWRNNGIAGRYNAGDLKYARNISQQQ